jgi:hypothetical protein
MAIESVGTLSLFARVQSARSGGVKLLGDPRLTVPLSAHSGAAYHAGRVLTERWETHFISHDGRNK